MIMSSVFIDTGAFYAALNKKDKHHRKTKEFFLNFPRKRLTLVTSNFVVAETHALLLNRVGREIASLWLQSIPTTIIRASEEDEDKAKEIILLHKDKDFSYCDALSFSIIERLSIKQVLSFGKHFRHYGKFNFIY